MGEQCIAVYADGSTRPVTVAEAVAIADRPGGPRCVVRSAATGQPILRSAGLSELDALAILRPCHTCEGTGVVRALVTALADHDVEACPDCRGDL